MSVNIQALSQKSNLCSELIICSDGIFHNSQITVMICTHASVIKLSTCTLSTSAKFRFTPSTSAATLTGTRRERSERRCHLKHLRVGEEEESGRT